MAQACAHHGQLFSHYPNTHENGTTFHPPSRHSHFTATHTTHGTGVWEARLPTHFGCQPAHHPSNHTAPTSTHVHAHTCPFCPTNLSPLTTCLPTPSIGPNHHRCPRHILFCRTTTLHTARARTNGRA